MFKCKIYLTEIPLKRFLKLLDESEIIKKYKHNQKNHVLRCSCYKPYKKARGLYFIMGALLKIKESDVKKKDIGT